MFRLATAIVLSLVTLTSAVAQEQHAAAPRPEPAAQVMTLPGVGALHVNHMGYGVADINATMNRFGTDLGLTWAPVQTASFPIKLPGGVSTMAFQLTHSLQTPTIELVHVVSATGVGALANPWQATPYTSTANVSFAVPNLPAADAALTNAGWPQVATVSVPGVSASVFAFHRGPAGILVELIDQADALPE